MCLQGIDTLSTLASKYFHPLFVPGNKSPSECLAAEQKNIKDGKFPAICKLVLGILQLSMINGEEGCSEEETLFPIQGHSQLNFTYREKITFSSREQRFWVLVKIIKMSLRWFE